MTALTGIIMPAVPRASREVRACAFTVIKQLSCTHADFVNTNPANTQDSVVEEVLDAGGLDGAVEPGARVAETGNDVSDLVEPLVFGAADNRPLPP